MNIDPDKTITYIKTDTIKLQKRLDKKMNTKYSPTENETQATKSRHRSTSRSKEKEKNQKPTPNPSIETKNNSKMEIEMDSMPTIKKPGQLKQKAQAPIGQAGRVHTNAKVISERPGDLSQILCSPFTIKNQVTYGNKQSNAQGSTRSYSIKSMDCNADRIVASLNLEGITNNYKTWNHLALHKQMSSIHF